MSKVWWNLGFVYVPNVWWESLIQFDKYGNVICLHYKSMMKYFVYISKQFVYISKVWWNNLFPFQSSLFTYQKYDEILCLHNKSIWYFIILSNENKTNLSLYYRNVNKLVLILFCICSSRLGLKLGFRLVS